MDKHPQDAGSIREKVRNEKANDFGVIRFVRVTTGREGQVGVIGHQNMVRAIAQDTLNRQKRKENRLVSGAVVPLISSNS